MPTAPRTAARTATSALTVVLAVGAVAAALSTPHGRLLAAAPSVPPVVLLPLVALAFLCSEVATLHVELRRQVYTFTGSGVALVLGVMYVDAHQLVVARLAGAALAFAWQRPPLRKLAYNLAAYALEPALLGVAAHGVLGERIDLGLHDAAVLCALVVAVDLVMSLFVMLVITWHQGRLDLTQVAEILAPTLALSPCCTAAACGIAVLTQVGPLGVVLVVGFLAGSVAVYRNHLLLGRRHQSLELMHEFVAQGVGSASVEELAEKMLVRVRRILHAAQVELRVEREGGDVVLGVDEDDAFTVLTGAAVPPRDWLVTRVLTGDESIVVPRHTREKGMRTWLTAHDARDALVVPLTGSVSGVIVVRDRLGEASTFTVEDLTLLQTLAGHVAVALHGSRLVQQLRHEAGHDALTGLPNRTLLIERMQAVLLPDPSPQLSLDPVGRATAPASVLLLDLDRFKEVNDALGHHVGDALLQVVATRLAAAVPPGATVARLGGDEFAVLLAPAPDAATGAARTAAAIVAALGHPVHLGEVTVTTRGSVGIALATDGLSTGDVLRHADTAMYAAKDGDESIVTYTAELDAGRAERLALLTDLHLALERDELELRYQPQLDLRTGEVVSLEALVRWRHPQRGLIGPDVFIPLAESSGAIEELTQQVLRQALTQGRRWLDQGLDVAVGVNLSAHNVNNDGLPDAVAALLAETGLPADRLVLEITESSVMGDPERTVPTLQRLADLGVTLSLDDFGTGYSSMAYLQRLPVSEVKIDRSFVTGMASPEGARTSGVLVRSILALGASLGLRVVAEGVEDEVVLDHLRELGCDLAQGYVIGRPQTAAELAEVLVPRHGARRGHLRAVAG